MDKAYYGVAHYGNARYDVYIPDWDNRVLPRLMKVDGSTVWKRMLRRFKAR